MFTRLLLCITVAALALTGCSTPYEKKDQEAEKERTGQKIKDQSDDTSFQSFLGRVRTAANRKDRVVLTTLMSRDFGYQWGPTAPEETPFDYWDKQNLWGELQTTLREKFVPNEGYMVAPAAVVTDPTYQGYRAGMRLVKGTWKFAYFVGPEEPGM